MASLLSKEPVCRKEDCLLIDIGTVYRVISSSCTDVEKFWFIESVWKPDHCSSSPRQKKPLESSESFDRTIAEVK